MNSPGTTNKSLLLSFVWIFLFSCGTKESVDLTADRAEILRLHNEQRNHHFNKDSIAFARQLSDNFISVNKGIISRPGREETISRYNGYFSSVEFVKWDDLSEPIIRFSEDGSMAYTIVDKLVMITYENETGERVEGKTHFAWTAIYKKYGDEWKIDVVTSTERPPG
ncbi:MAG: nuclear transport factor 2 family protein [Cyclobacteriaceae bacterium]